MIIAELLRLIENKSAMFQVRVSDKDDWQDVALHAADLDVIARAVSEPESAKFDLGELTELVEKFIGDGPEGYGPKAGSWDEMDYDVKSHSDDVLKIQWTFGGYSRRSPIKKTGVMTIMSAT